MIDAYIKRVKEGVDSRIDTLRDIKNFGAYPGLSTPSIDEHGDPIDVEMDKQSDLWPRDAEAIIGQITTILAPSIDLMKAPIDPEKFTGVVGATDFGAYSFTPERVTLQWNRKKSKLYAFGRTEYEKKFWSANGKITSILEFLGAQILITLPGSSNANLFNPIPGMRPPDKQKVDIQRSLLIHTIALSISNGRTIWLRGSQLKRGKYVSGYPVFSFIFPTTEADFKQVTTSSDED